MNASPGSASIGAVKVKEARDPAPTFGMPVAFSHRASGSLQNQ
jgi:hypothetical protein